MQNQRRPIDPVENLLPVIRNAARALIFRGERILLLRKDGGGQGVRYALPGGAQDPGETLEQALNRECLEEIGTEVEVLDLLHVADYFKPRDSVPPSTRHLVEFLFACRVPGDYTPRNGHHPDKHQIQVEWIARADLDSLCLQPLSLVPYLVGMERSHGGVYLGLID